MAGSTSGPPPTIRRQPSIRRLTAWLRQLASTLQAFDVAGTPPFRQYLEHRRRRTVRLNVPPHPHRPERRAASTGRGQRGRPAADASAERKRAATVDLSVQSLINCTGPERDLARLASPLVKALLARGLVEPDPLGLGAITTERGELVDASGAIVHGAYVVGAWRIPRLFESTAVPELREQAADVASDLVARLAVSGVELSATA
jgi:uncharacterized NAD(P)/FAD-binding protein YdhS